MSAEQNPHNKGLKPYLVSAVGGIVSMALGLRLTAPWAFTSVYLLIPLGAALTTGSIIFIVWRTQRDQLWEIAAALGTVAASLLALYALYLQLASSPEPAFDLDFMDAPGSVLAIENDPEADPWENDKFRGAKDYRIANERNYIVVVTNRTRFPATDVAVEMKIVDGRQEPIFLYAVAVKGGRDARWIDQSDWSYRKPSRTAAADQSLTLNINRMGSQDRIEIYIRFAYDSQKLKVPYPGSTELRNILKLAVWATDQKFEPPKERLVTLKI